MKVRYRNGAYNDWHSSKVFGNGSAYNNEDIGNESYLMIYLILVGVLKFVRNALSLKSTRKVTKGQREIWR